MPRYLPLQRLYLCLKRWFDTVALFHTCQLLLLLTRTIQATKRQSEDISSRRPYFNGVPVALVTSDGKFCLQARVYINFTGWQYNLQVLLALGI